MSLLKRTTPGGTPPSTPPPFPPRPGTPLGGLGARPNQRVIWEFAPLVDTIVYFDIGGILDDVYKAAGLHKPKRSPLAALPESPLNQEEPHPTHPAAPNTRPSPFKPLPPPPPTSAHVFAAELENHAEAEAALEARLDAAWGEAPFMGAALVYTWRQEVKAALVARFQAIEQPPVIWRATDPLFVLNVLSRARTHVLLGNAPPALERGFLDRILYTDDPRIVNMAQASGVSEFALVEPPVEEEFKLEEEE
ncbi:MAG: hypothetical protein IT320_28080 [Anaerolineae bacterium]|nr:hypothetical protein [Anaerolineae bacterium]